MRRRYFAITQTLTGKYMHILHKFLHIQNRHLRIKYTYLFIRVVVTLTFVFISNDVNDAGGEGGKTERNGILQ